MKQVSAHGDTADTSILRAETIPFAEIPGQTKLFLDYQKDPLSLREFYPSAVASHVQIADLVPDVLASYNGNFRSRGLTALASRQRLVLLN